MSSIFGKNIKVSIFGQSHSKAIGVCIDGLPSGIKIDFDELYEFLKRRAPGGKKYATARTEADMPEILSGIVDGMTCGAPFAAIIANTDVKSGDYDNIRAVPRPGHADFTAHIKFGDSHDIRGGGHFSGRLTAPLCVAGGICIQILRKSGIEIAAHIKSVGDISDTAFDSVNIEKSMLIKLRQAEFPVIDETQGELMRAEIESARIDNDSVGGIIECAAINVPSGIGNPMFNGMENRISEAIFAVPAVKGIEFGNGFDTSKLRGSQNNDSYYYENQTVKTRTNNHGGILGGITSGMPILFRVAIKPTPSIGIVQDSINLRMGENTKLEIKGRHDPCIVPRAVPCIEAAVALAIYDAMLD